MTNKLPNNHPALTRLESILKTLVIQVTGRLELPATSFNERVEQLANRLANAGTIVLVGDLHPSLRDKRLEHIQNWVNAYAQLYYLLNVGLFDMTDEPKVYLADDKYPVIVVFEAHTLVVTRVLSGLVIPYIALRQSDGKASRIELRGLIETVLEELAAGNLPPEQRDYIRDQGLKHFNTLLQSEIRQVSLMDFSRQFEIDSGTAQTPIEHTPRPDSLPELPQQKANTTQLSPGGTPDNILKIPLPGKQSDADVPVPRPSMLNRLRRRTD